MVKEKKDSNPRLSKSKIHILARKTNGKKIYTNSDEKMQSLNTCVTFWFEN